LWLAILNGRYQLVDQLLHCGADVTVEMSFCHVRSSTRLPLLYDPDQELSTGNKEGKQSSIWDTAKRDAQVQISLVEYALRIGATRHARDILRINSELPLAGSESEMRIMQLLKLANSSTETLGPAYEADLREIWDTLKSSYSCL